MRNVVPKSTIDIFQIFIEKAELIQQNGNPYLMDRVFLETMEKLRITSIGLLESLKFQVDNSGEEHVDE